MYYVILQLNSLSASTAKKRIIVNQMAIAQSGRRLRWHMKTEGTKIQMCFATENSVSIGSNLKNRSPQKRPLDFTFLIFSGANTESRARRSAGQLGEGGSTPGRSRGQMHASQLKRATRCFAARIRAIVERKVIASVTW